MLELLTGFLGELGSAGESAAEFLSLYQSLVQPPPWKQYLAVRGVLLHLAELVTHEIQELHRLEDTTLTSDLAQGTVFFFGHSHYCGLNTILFMESYLRTDMWVLFLCILLLMFVQTFCITKTFIHLVQCLVFNTVARRGFITAEYGRHDNYFGNCHLLYIFLNSLLEPGSVFVIG